ncbi:ribokinase [Gracilibacillus alcaliphilus]|uniref:ribokinase n=1 Tax=Gracilibacillus alcaliphilus TaxID=1401441 RepID=UPI00195C34BF|nr:ribokinase [Gracilibacillus alcaliphilus]MBM7677300.1 ribokinase [Gracilibacillus alcaliphilus]
MKYDVILLGSINMDVVVDVPKYPEYGDTVFCNSIKMIPGGKGANQAVTVGRLGKQVAMVGAVGQDSAGDQLIKNLEKQHVDTEHVLRIEQEGTGTFVATIDQTGENTMMGTKGANDAITTADIEKVFSDIEAEILLVQMETSRESILAAMKIAKERGMFVILDPAPADGIFEEAFSYADLVLPNNQETERITGVKVIDQATALQAAGKIHELGIPNVIVKMGADGSLVYQEGETTFVEALQVNAVDTIGAGDCFAGAVACEFLNTNDLVAAAKFASIASGIKVSRTGGHDSIPTLEEVKARQ